MGRGNGLQTGLTNARGQRVTGPYLGFAIMTLGALVGGVIDIVVPQILDGDWLPASVFAQSLLTTIAFAVILYSLFVD